MDVRDQSIKLDKARNHYREAQEELKASYDKDLNGLKNVYDARTKKQAKNYAAQKTKLEEQNQINNELYAKKTSDAINRSQEDFKNRLRDNTSRFEEDRVKSRNELSDKLASLSESYKKSFDENDRYEEQIKKSMAERYAKANNKYQADFNEQVKNLEEKATAADLKNREHDRVERADLQNKNHQAFEDLRTSSSEQKFKEISRLRDDNENLRTTLERENQLLKDRQSERVAELLRTKSKENEIGQKNFEELQKNIRDKNKLEQEKQNETHKKEAKESEKRFNEDVRNIQRISNQKIQGGSMVENLQDQLKETKSSYENRLRQAREETGRISEESSRKETAIDEVNRNQMRELKASKSEAIAKRDIKANEDLNKAFYENRERSNALEEKHKKESTSLAKEKDEEISHITARNKTRIKDQRVEFGRIVNNMNDKNMDTLNSLKEEYSKDKTEFTERAKRDFSEEKTVMKSDFNKEIGVRESLYEQKLGELEKQTSRIIDNYENRMAQIARKTEKEVENLKASEEERKQKESKAHKLAIENMQINNQIELGKMRDKYEHMISRDRAVNEQQMNRTVQKYQDQLERERLEHQKESSTRLGEARIQYERLYESSEIEKEAIRDQYEQRIENMKLATLSSQQPNSKKV